MEKELRILEISKVLENLYKTTLYLNDFQISKLNVLIYDLEKELEELKKT